jgi:hypothetical protein
MESTHQYVVAQLQAAKGQWPTIADESGVPLRTLEKIANRKKQPKAVTNLEKLTTYFRKRRPRRS